MSFVTKKLKGSTFSNDSMSKLIKERQWSKLQKVLSSKNIPPRFNDSDSPLVLACKYGPPVDVVSALIEAFPSAINITDSDDMLPLHVACGYGASPKVIRELLRSNKDAMWHRDKSGMLPIHIVCRLYYDNLCIWEVPEDYAFDAMVQTLQYLLKAAPSTLLEEDLSGICPIEHALESDMDIEIVTALQIKAQKVQKVKQRLQGNLF